MSAVILDTETTDADAPDVIELAYMGPLADPADVCEIVSTRYKPTKQITLGAMAVHHILPSDLDDCPRWPGTWWAIAAEVGYLVGHNVDFDWKAIGSPHVKRICTLALARYLWPLIDSHSLSASVYHIHVDLHAARTRLVGAHGAAIDVGNVRFLLWKMIDALREQGHAIASWEELWQLSEIARVPSIMPFGKHKGTAMRDVPSDYKRWLLNQPDVDPYLAKALKA